MPYSRVGFTGRFQCFCVAYISRVSKFEIRFSFGGNLFSLEVVLVHSWHFLFLRLSCLWQCVAASLYCWALLRVSPWPWRKMKGGMLQGDEEEGEQLRQGGVHSSGILLGWSICTARSVSAIDVNTVSDPEFQPHPPPSSPVPTVLPTGTTSQWKRWKETLKENS